MSHIKDIYEIFTDTAKSNLHKKSTLLIFLLISLISLIWLFSGSNLKNITGIEWFVIVSTLLCLVIIWFLLIRIPKNKRNHVGFVVAMTSETEDQYDKITNDFILALRDLLSNESLSRPFNFIILPRHHAHKITSVADARKYLYATRSHFILYGRTKSRKINKENRHVILLNGVVLHSPISPDIGKVFSKEFTELFPSKLIISEENDLFSFEITSELISYVSLYIIGIASFVSFDVDYSQYIFEKLEDKLQTVSINLPAIIKLKHRLPDCLVEVYIRKTQLAYDAFRQDKRPEHLDEMKANLDNIQSKRNYHYGCNLFLSIYYFYKEKNIDKAISILRKCKKENDPLWRYNLAFIYSYIADMKRASQYYWTAFKYMQFPLNKILEIEEFIYWVLQDEPDKIQLHYCLGLINFSAKRDYSRALLDFERFLSNVNVEDFPSQVAKANEYIQSCRERISLNA